MEAEQHHMSTLFAQLGLPNDEQSITEFVQQHTLTPKTPIWEAPFWNSAQARFLHESLHQNAEWCEIIDELNILLHSPA
jgi:hypothetical protein